MPELAQSVVGESKFVIRKRLINVEGFLGRHSDLELVLGPGIGNNLEVVNAVEEGPVRGYGPKVIIGFIQEGMSEIWTERYLLRRSFRIPSELRPLILVKKRDLVLNRMMESLIHCRILCVSLRQRLHASIVFQIHKCAKVDLALGIWLRNSLILESIIPTIRFVTIYPNDLLGHHTTRLELRLF